ncbi:uncharacterized protein LOC130899111 [Diorhabda carinulata]|uniref:uncharacterized protein LOC130899111 n=1 Tax=Diorhabda carinulata TaxID=1163345 RepID=UPI0025A0B14A|nr:uncharacterized protein LOC130899111 [Diorhabda carinulata]
MASVGFRWLDILEKEFDKAFVDLDLNISELESEEASLVFNVRQKLCTLSSCFAQLTHKAQTIFQNSAKLEAELIHMRAELIESKSKREVLENELHHLLLQLHSSQLSRLPDSLGNKKQDQYIKPDVNMIKQKFEAEIRQSPIHTVSTKDQDELKINPMLLEPAQYKANIMQLESENASLRNEVLSLTSEVYGAKLAAKYLDKELAGRIQQLQLLGREMRGDIRDKLWRQLESEILLQRHKTVVRACRRNSALNGTSKLKPDADSNADTTEHFGDIRTVLVRRKPDQGLGISITGGREHGVPILISELEPNGPAALSEQLYIGDAILFVNDIDLRNTCHREAVSILQQQQGDSTLQVQYVAADDSDNSLEEDGFNFRFFDESVCDTNSATNYKSTEDIINTPTAPRTPDSSSGSRSPKQNISSADEIFSSIGIDKKQIEHFQNIFDNITGDNGNLQEYNDLRQSTNEDVSKSKSNNNDSPENITKNITTDNDYNVDTNDLILLDNVTNNIIKLENFKKVDVMSTIENNCNTSTNSLNSENLSSPMQTSTDIYLDSEIISTDVASNDSQSPKNLQEPFKVKFNYGTGNVKPESELKLYTSNESLSNPKSDQSLLNSEDSYRSSPVYKLTREYKKQKKYKKKYFGVKTLQSIFSKYDGYSDIDTTASEFGDDPPRNVIKEMEIVETDSNKYADISPQFEENIHSLLSDIFVKHFPVVSSEQNASINLNRTVGTKKYFSLHGQNLRVGKALKLCPNDEFTDNDSDQKKEKLLARYVYNANSLSAEGIGDPDFGTPV